MSHFSHFSGTLLLMLSLILILKCRSMELTLVQIMAFLHDPSNSERPGFAGTWGQFQKIAAESKGHVSVITYREDGRQKLWKHMLIKGKVKNGG